MLALAQMDPALQGIFFLAAIILWLVAAFAVPRRPLPFELVALGLALFAIPFCWNAFAAA